MEPRLSPTEAADPLRPRVARLAVTSAIALGMIWQLARRTPVRGSGAEIALAAGWLLMPSILVLSLRWRRWRYALIAPSLLVLGGLVWMCAVALPAGGAARVGWLVLTAGIAMGGALGMWFWYEWMPIPESWRDPNARARWGFIAVHVALVVAGGVLVAIA